MRTLVRTKVQATILLLLLYLLPSTSVKKKLACGLRFEPPGISVQSSPESTQLSSEMRRMPNCDDITRMTVAQ